MAKILRQRGQQWYAHIAIPRPLRKHFLRSSGKPMDAIWKPLGPNRDDARALAAQLAADYERVFNRLRAGEQMTPEQISTAVASNLSAELARVRREAAEFSGLVPSLRYGMTLDEQQRFEAIQPSAVLRRLGIGNLTT